MYHPIMENGGPPAYGAPPKVNLLTSLSGQWIIATRAEEVEESNPKRFHIWTTYRYLEEVSVYEILRYRLRFQIYNNEDGVNTHKSCHVKMLSCGLSDSNNEDEEIYIEVEVRERPDNRITEEELTYIRKLDEMRIRKLDKK